MNEEEILKIVDNFIDGYRQYDAETGETIIPYKYGEGQKFVYKEDFEAIQGLLDLDTQKDKLIDEIILYIIRHNYFDTTEFDKNIVPTIENIKKYFEERCK